jgi:tRNA A37 threonylcarbamoyladenosine modification protein TsaB
MTHPHRTITLGIEMSNPGANTPGAIPAHAVALWDERGTLLGSSALPDTSRGSDAVMDAIATLAQSCGVAPVSIGRIIVSIGPGGYTALRIATTSAKVLADTLGAELIAVPSARVASVSIEESHRPALIALASKKNKCHASLLASDGSIEELGIIDADALSTIAPCSIIADHHLPKSFHERASILGVEVRPLRLDVRDLLVASRGIEPIDPLLCAPKYAREPDAVTQWRARGS